MSEIIAEYSGRILRVQLNRPARKNAMTAAMYITLAHLFNNIAKNDHVRVILLHGAGDSFCAGNDLEDFLTNPPGAGESPQALLIEALINFDKPIVAAVHGAAIGAGTTMLTHCDFVFAGKSAKFKMPFVNLAVVPEFGASCTVPARFGYIRSAELILLGLPFDASRAVELGLATRVLPDEELLAAATETAHELAEKPPAALQACKRLMRSSTREQLERAAKLENQEFSVRVRSAEAKEAFTAFLEKRSPHFTGTSELPKDNPNERKTMVEHETSKSKGPALVNNNAVGRLFFLEASDGRILSVNADGSDRKVIVSQCRIPDGVVVDLQAGHLYWTNMGIPTQNDGSIERADLDGQNRKTIVPQGATFTPKQLHLAKKASKLYWCDREGMRVIRSNLDGSNMETLIDTSGGETRPGTDQTKWCVGITVDPDRGQIYWTQKGPDDAGKGRIFRAGIDIPKGENAAHRTDIEVLFDGLPEPIDLELDLKNRLIYWTDRGDPPRGNTVSRASMDLDFKKQPTPEILVTHLKEGIGIALDFEGGRMFVTDLAGSIYSARLDGSGKKPLLVAQGNLTGIAYVKPTTKEH